MTAISEVLRHRSWLVPDFGVWGVPGFGETELLLVEKVGSQSTVFYGSIDIGGVEQEVTFESLIDHRGNHLPATIASPVVIPIPKGPALPFVIGRGSAIGFRIAHSAETAAGVQTDLLVVEMGD